MSDRTRLDKIESVMGAKPCRCGVDKVTGKPVGEVEFVIDTNPEGKPFVPEFCPECGRQINFTLNIGTPGKARADE
jgi:hypothetical protein